MPRARSTTESDWYAFMRFDPAQHRRARGYYVPFFKGCLRVLDVACGRGEFLDVLRDARIPGEGIDTDEGMVQAARASGNQVELGDAFGFLEAHPASFDGIFSAHFIEHLESEVATRLIELSVTALRPGGCLVVATPNSASLPTLQHEFWWDPTHVRLYDIDLIRFWFSEAGFADIKGGENPESHPGSPIGLKELEMPPANPFARALYRLTGISALRRQQMVLSRSLQGLIRELYRPSEIYVTGRKPAR